MNDTALPRWRVLPALALGTLMATIDISAVNIALPTLSRSFGVPLTSIEWVVLAYVVTITGLLVTFGRVADRIGRRRVYGIGLGIFTLASALCAMAQTAPMLFATRALQGLGAAMMTANSSALLIANFPAAERGQALGAFGAVVGAGLALGPPLGGILVGALSWRWIFLINIPLGLLAQWQLRTRVPADPATAEPARLDLPGAALWSGGLVLVMLGVSRGPDSGWTTEVWAMLGAAAVLLVGFLLIERRSDAPLLPPALLLGPMGGTAALTLIGQALSIGIGIHMPLYLEEVRGFDAFRSGRWLAVIPIAALLLAPLAGRWSDRFGPRRIALAGMALAAVGLFVLSAGGLEPPALQILGGMATIGIGLGLFTVPNASALLSAAPQGQLGLASGLQATMRNLGIAGGAAATTAVAASRYLAHGGGRLAAGRTPIVRPAMVLATRDVYWVLAGLALLGVGLIAFQSRPEESPARAAALPS